MAWGDRYVAELFDVTLAAALAPGNLPAAVEQLECDVVILTETSRFDQLRNHPVLRGIERLCPVELRPVDEFITRPDAYGMALTYALFRGFEDLGEDMVNVHLMFLNSDFVLADGSLRTVARKILEGERLILAPSYCVIGEIVRPELDRRRDSETSTIAIPARQLAAIGIRNRHNTIRGKTINQQLFSMEWIDQFYWLVDQETILARQLPIAVISMRPQHVLTDMVTFWDYGIISHACPTTPRCVIADSDEFLMIELRSADTAREQIRLGRPSPEQIARKLYRFITADPLELAQHTLIWHSADLPRDLLQAEAALDRYVGEVLSYLSQPMDYRDHYIWCYHYPTFHKLRGAYLASKGTPLSWDVDKLVEYPPHPLEREFDEAFVAAAAGSARYTTAILADPAGSRGSLHAPPSETDLPDLEPVWQALEHGRVLLLNSRSLSIRLFRVVGGLPVEFDGLPPWINAHLLNGSTGLGSQLSAQDGCDLCLCEITPAELLYLRDLLATVSHLARTGSKIYLFCLNPQTGSLALPSEIFASDALSIEFPARVSFVGMLPRPSSASEVAPGSLYSASRVGSARSFLEFLREGSRQSAGSQLAVFDEPPDQCLGMVMEIDVALRHAGPLLVIKPRPIEIKAPLSTLDPLRSISQRAPQAPGPKLPRTDIDAPPLQSADQRALQELGAMLTSISAEKDSLIAAQASLRADIDRLSVKLAAMENENENVAVERSRLLAERRADALRTAAERGTLRGRLVSVEAELSAVRAAYDRYVPRMAAESETTASLEAELSAKIAAAEKEKENAVAERSRLLTERQLDADRMAAERKTLHGQIASLEAELSAVDAANNSDVQQAAAEPGTLASLKVELSAVRAAFSTRIAELEDHNRQLTEAATERARELQERSETNYQIIMAQQQLLAGMKDADPRFLEIYERCREYTMTSVERLYALYKSVEYIVAAGLEGDFVETGVWRGGSCMLIAETLVALGDTSRRILLFDTFSGHPKPDEEADVDVWGNSAIEEWERRQATGETWAYVSLDEVRANMMRTGYPADRTIFLQGLVEDTLPRIGEIGPLALIRLDTDWYRSACVSLEHLYPRLVEGGVLIMDDYGHYEGQRRALDEYLAAKGEHLLLNRIDYSCRVAVKGCTTHSEVINS